MSIFVFTIDNDHIDGQPFIIEADDLIAATMAATDFVRNLDEITAGRLEETGVRESRILSVQDTRAFWANDEGIGKYLDEVVQVHEEEEE